LFGLFELEVSNGYTETLSQNPDNPINPSSELLNPQIHRLPVEDGFEHPSSDRIAV
jgi:hypothetical protein